MIRGDRGRDAGRTSSPRSCSRSTRARRCRGRRGTAIRSRHRARCRRRRSTPSPPSRSPGPVACGSRAASAPCWASALRAAVRPVNGASPRSTRSRSMATKSCSGTVRRPKSAGSAMGPEAFAGPGPVDCVEGDAQARARRVDPDGSAVVEIVRDRVHRPGRRCEIRLPGLPVRRPDGGAAGEQESQGQARARPPPETVVVGGVSDRRHAASGDNVATPTAGPAAGRLRGQDGGSPELP